MAKIGALLVKNLKWKGVDSTMSLYDHLQSYYDLVFPTKKEVVDFLDRQFAQDSYKRILDVACGTGGQAIALAKRGYQLLAMDLHQEMVEAGRTKSKEQKVGESNPNSGSVHFEVMDMTKLTFSASEQWEGLYCIGNSLPHLTKPGQIVEALANWQKQLTSPQKTMVIQIVNFAKIIEQGGQFPLLTGEKEDVKVTFQRHYEEAEQDGLITFVTHLKVEKGANNKTWQDKTLLKPLKREELQSYLHHLGYEHLQWYGDLTGKAFDEQKSPAVVVVARMAS
ncbi:class I SAM-dependent methyltransferase [Heliorestis acidaminivorans]|uniref:Class I SAM-dependent methyltransferase n=1 Tax=Heliorestis acidaminivorans TaxID=553427 RepID=A0A6I0F4X5_9FIRM|nr:class I SAM-dependent methyltransferase [Heliorestis acidaminivorans]KAB2953882.1 class I SAM-dependent methyltransferase [Heliorestis acidaminivorans]